MIKSGFKPYRLLPIDGRPRLWLGSGAASDIASEKLSLMVKAIKMAWVYRHHDST